MRRQPSEAHAPRRAIEPRRIRDDVGERCDAAFAARERERERDHRRSERAPAAEPARAFEEQHGRHPEHRAQDRVAPGDPGDASGVRVVDRVGERRDRGRDPRAEDAPVEGARRAARAARTRACCAGASAPDAPATARSRRGGWRWSAAGRRRARSSAMPTRAGVRRGFRTRFATGSRTTRPNICERLRVPRAEP